MSACKRCSECEGQKHHWNDFDDDPTVEPFVTCKHCDLKVSVDNDESTTFIETSDGSHTFYFVCEGCGAEGILSAQIDRVSDRVWCPDECGAQYILWVNPITKNPALMCVICPVFEEVAEMGAHL